MMGAFPEDTGKELGQDLMEQVNGEGYVGGELRIKGRGVMEHQVDLVFVPKIRCPVGQVVMEEIRDKELLVLAQRTDGVDETEV